MRLGPSECHRRFRRTWMNLRTSLRGSSPARSTKASSASSACRRVFTSSARTAHICFACASPLAACRHGICAGSVKFQKSLATACCMSPRGRNFRFIASRWIRTELIGICFLDAARFRERLESIEGGTLNLSVYRHIIRRRKSSGE